MFGNLLILMFFLFFQLTENELINYSPKEPLRTRNLSENNCQLGAETVDNSREKLTNSQEKMPNSRTRKLSESSVQSVSTVYKAWLYILGLLKSLPTYSFEIQLFLHFYLLTNLFKISCHFLKSQIIEAPSVGIISRLLL